MLREAAEETFGEMNNGDGLNAFASHQKFHIVTCLCKVTRRFILFKACICYR
jgi:hypothetical protein